MSDAYHYVVVRSDLLPGKAVAMVAHAAAITGSGHTPETAVVILGADRRQLECLANLLALEHDEHGLTAYEHYETLGGEVQLAAVGIAPGPRQPAQGYVEHLSLYTGGKP
jgi:hypothetical protein